MLFDGHVSVRLKEYYIRSYMLSDKVMHSRNIIIVKTVLLKSTSENHMGATCEIFELQLMCLNILGFAQMRRRESFDLFIHV